jgi:hypothetical protein
MMQNYVTKIYDLVNFSKIVGLPGLVVNKVNSKIHEYAETRPGLHSFLTAAAPFYGEKEVYRLWSLPRGQENPNKIYRKSGALMAVVPAIMKYHALPLIAIKPSTATVATALWFAYWYICGTIGEDMLIFNERRLRRELKEEQDNFQPNSDS